MIIFIGARSTGWGPLYGSGCHRVSECETPCVDLIDVTMIKIIPAFKTDPVVCRLK